MLGVFLVAVLSDEVAKEEAKEVVNEEPAEIVFPEVPDLPAAPAPLPFFFDNFRDADWQKRWVVTEFENYTGKWEVREATEPIGNKGEQLLVASSGSAYHGISTAFATPIDPSKGFILQFEFRQLDSLECGGGYLKLFGEGFQAGKMTNESQYVIMFGPDKCGSDKVHFIFRHKSPLTGLYEEKHLKSPPGIKSGKANHLYTLKTREDNTFEVLVDGVQASNGSLLEKFQPPVNPPKEIDDPTDSKPADWIDEAQIPDPNATKPEDWDETAPEFIPDPEKVAMPEGWLTSEPSYIADPDAQKPGDWDDDVHGQWDAPMIANPACKVGCGEYEPPLIRNPAYKGKWAAPKIPNPAYIGPWKARQIPNPNYCEDLLPSKFAPIYGIGYELWLVTANQAFTNVYIGTNEADLKAWNDAHFLPKAKVQADWVAAKQAVDAKKAEEEAKKRDAERAAAEAAKAAEDATKAADEPATPVTEPSTEDLLAEGLRLREAAKAAEEAAAKQVGEPTDKILDEALKLQDEAKSGL